MNFSSSEILNNKVSQLFDELQPTNRFEVSCAIINLSSDGPVLFGHNMDHFVYPASVYKIFIAAEVLRQVETNEIALQQEIILEEKNVVGDNGIFPKKENRSLIGKKFTVDELLRRMLAVSDNSASNQLIDLVSRESITKNIIEYHGWHGSGVTRKFLDRLKEDKKYRFSDTTMSCARHIAEFLCLVEKGELISQFVSVKLKEYMTLCRNTEFSLSIPEFNTFYHKTGSLETNYWQHGILSAFKNFIKKRWTIIKWQNDAGVVTSKDTKYVIVVLTVYKTNTKKLFPMKEFSKRILHLVNEYKQ